MCDNLKIKTEYPSLSGHYVNNSTCDKTIKQHWNPDSRSCHVCKIWHD